MTDLGAVFELRRAMERGEPTYRVGVNTLTMGQVERAIAEGRYPEQVEDMKRWLAGEQAAWQARLISDAAEAIEVVGEDELERAARAPRCDYPKCRREATKARENGAHGTDRYCDRHDSCACDKFMVKIGETFTGDPDDLADTTEGEHRVERCDIHGEVIYRAKWARTVQALQDRLGEFHAELDGEPDAAEVLAAMKKLDGVIDGALKRAGG